METGIVVVEFSNGDPPLKMTSLKTGRWDGTWQTNSRALAGVTVTVKADDPAQKLQGRREISGGLGETRAPPVLRPDGIVSVASLTPHVPVAPGSFITLFGERLSQGEDQAATIPWGTQLAGAIVTINEKRLALQYARDGQLNAMIPFGIELNTSHQILVQRGTTYAQPISIDVAAAQPAIFRMANGQGIVYGPNGLVSVENPVQAEDRVMIYCAGLGAVDPAVPAGAAAPADPAAVVTAPVTLTIGGKQAAISFVGMVPNLVGLYSVEATVPGGVAPGPTVPLFLTVAGQASQETFLAVR
jgi:uncharacterized protein (TIGR03437 family)